MISTGKPKQYISREMTPQWLKITLMNQPHLRHRVYRRRTSSVFTKMKSKGDPVI